MTAVVLLSCDRMRNGQPCRGALPTQERTHLGARRLAARTGWTSTLVALPDGAHAYVDTCPSLGHDDPEGGS